MFPAMNVYMYIYIYMCVCIYIYKYRCIQAGLQSNTWKLDEIGNIHGNWYPNKQPRGLVFLGYPLEIKDANGQFPFSAGISWLVMVDTTGGYAGL